MSKNILLAVAFLLAAGSLVTDRSRIRLTERLAIWKPKRAVRLERFVRVTRCKSA